MARVEAYNKASLAGDVVSNMAVSFENENHSKGQVTAGKVAVMRIVGFPRGTVTEVVAYVKSNAKSGAGVLKVLVDAQEVCSISGTYDTWPGMTGYSTAFAPFAFAGSWLTHAGSEVGCRLEGTANSLELEQVVVRYMVRAPEAEVVRLSWLDEEGNRQETELKETSAGSGVVLPASEVKELDDNWRFVGWTQEKLEEMYVTHPSMWLAGDSYYPESATTLYALYEQSEEREPVKQSRTFTTGEYALVHASAYGYRMMLGSVMSGIVGSSPVAVSTDEQGWKYLMEGYVAANSRYGLEFEGDSVKIKHLQSGEYIGHEGTKLANKAVKWAWTEQQNGSMELSYNREAHESGDEGRVVWLHADGYFEVMKLRLGQDVEYMLLFDVAGVATSGGVVRWTSCPFGAEGIEAVEVESRGRKVFRGGVMYIEQNGAKYDVLGRKIE